MSQTRSPLYRALPLFLVIFIDSMGLGILIPVLTAILITPHSHFFPSHTSLMVRDFWFGCINSIFMFCWFFGSAILGDLSDQIGRKKSLLICISGACIGYILSAIAVTYSSLALLLISRIIAGFTGGSESIAQAAVVDLSDTDSKSRYIGYILMVASIGFIAGPLLGGLLSNHHLISWFTYTTPLYFTALLAFINIILLTRLFSETAPSVTKQRIQWTRAIHMVAKAFRHQHLQRLSLILFFMMLSWSIYYPFIGLYVIHLYHQSALDVSLLLSLLAVGFALGSGVWVGPISARFGIHTTTRWAMGLMCVSLLLNLIHHVWIAWLMAFIIGVVMSIAYTDLLVLFSNEVNDNEQGWVMGATGSIMAMSFAITGIIGGLISGQSILLLMWICAGCMFIGAAIPFANKS